MILLLESKGRFEKFQKEYWPNYETEGGKKVSHLSRAGSDDVRARTQALLPLSRLQQNLEGVHATLAPQLRQYL